jgi:3-phytase/alkaline phosphatase D
VVAVAVAVAAAAGVAANASDGAKPPGLQFLGQAIIPTGTTFAGTTVGGLSSITYDAERNVFYTLSDDQSQLNPARFYTLRVDLSDGSLEDGDVVFVGVTTLLAPDGQPYPTASLDPEGLTLAKRGELVVTSEGIASQGISPWVRRYASTVSRRAPVPRVPA